MEKKRIIQVSAAFLLIVAFFFIFQPIDLGGDAAQYYNIADNLIKGNGYSKSPVPPYKSAIHYREPGYPGLIMLGLLFFKSLYAVIFIQILMHIATSLFVYGITFDFMNKKYAFMSAAGVLLFPTLINYNFCIITETSYTFLFMATVYFLYFGLKRQNTFFVILSSLTCGAAFLTKNIIMFFPAFFLLIGGVVLFKRPDARKYVIKPILLFFLIFSVITGSWFLYINYLYPGRNNLDPEVVDRGAFAFATRSELVNLSDRELQAYSLSIFSEGLVSKFYPEYGPGITTGRGFYYAKVITRYKSYYKDKNIIEIMGPTLKNHPFKFALTASLEIVSLNMFFQLPFLNANPDFQGNMYISAMRGMLKLAGLFILYFSIKGMILVIRRKGVDMALLSLLAPILYINSLFIFMDAVPRYSIPLIPFYLLFSVAGFCKEKVFDE